MVKMSLTFRVRAVLASTAPPSSHANAMKPRVTDIKMQLKWGRDNTEFMSTVKNINFSSWQCMMLVTQSSLCSGWCCIVWNAAQCQSRAKMSTQPCTLSCNYLYFKQQTNTHIKMSWRDGISTAFLSWFIPEFYSVVINLCELQVISVLFLVCVCVCVCTSSQQNNAKHHLYCLFIVYFLVCIRSNVNTCILLQIKAFCHCCAGHIYLFICLQYILRT